MRDEDGGRVGNGCGGGCCCGWFKLKSSPLLLRCDCKSSSFSKYLSRKQEISIQELFLVFCGCYFKFFRHLFIINEFSIISNRFSRV